MLRVSPIINVTNWSSRSFHGLGRRLTTMARPRKWEKGDGKVTPVTPDPDWVLAVKEGAISWEEYEALYREHLSFADLRPGKLLSDDGIEIRSGDTLLCACSREDAAAGKCHRSILAEVLKGAGWDVILDGVVI